MLQNSIHSGIKIPMQNQMQEDLFSSISSRSHELSPKSGLFNTCSFSGGSISNSNYDDKFHHEGALYNSHLSPFSSLETSIFSNFQDVLLLNCEDIQPPMLPFSDDPPLPFQPSSPPYVLPPMCLLESPHDQFNPMELLDCEVSGLSTAHSSDVVVPQIPELGCPFEFVEPTAIDGRDTITLCSGMFLGSSLGSISEAMMQVPEMNHKAGGGDMGFNGVDDRAQFHGFGNMQASGSSSCGQKYPATNILPPEEHTFKAVHLSVEQRKEKIHRYLKKRNSRNFCKKIKYACRKTLADNRPRVRGRFAKNDENGGDTKWSHTTHEDENDVEVRIFIKFLAFFSFSPFILISMMIEC